MNSSTEDANFPSSSALKSFVVQGEPKKSPDLPEVKLKFQVKDPVNTFTGRKTFLKKLHERIQQSRNKDKHISITSISGPGGIGKSETVRMYIKQFNEKYDNIVWIDAEHPFESKEQFKFLADHDLNIPLRDQDDNPREFSHIVEDVYKALCQKPKRLLIIFDNAEALTLDSGGIQSFLPQKTVTIEPPIVLITSREEYCRNVSVNSFPLGTWDHEECIEYILMRLVLWDTERNREDADKLAELFDKVPIAIEVAVSIINSGNVRYCIQSLISDYIRRRKSGSRDNSIQTTMQKLLEVCFDKIKKDISREGKLAIRILGFMAYLSPTKISKVIIEWLLPKTKTHKLDSALQLLEQYSIIQSCDSDEYFTIHRVFQQVIKRKLPNIKIPKMFAPTCLMWADKDKETVFRSITQKLVQNTSSELSEEQDTNNIITNMVLVADHIVQHSMTNKFYKTIETIAGFLTSINYEVAIKLYAALIDCVTKTKMHRFQRPPEKIFNKFWKIATIFYNNGRYRNACEIFNMLLHGGAITNKKLFYSSGLVLHQGQEKVLGDTHLNTLRTKNNIASCLKNQGKTVEALELYYAVLEEFEKELGPLHPDTLRTKNNTAECMSVQGNKEEALKLHYVVLKAREKALGIFHPDTIMTKHSIANCLNDKGEKEAALKLYYVVLEGQEKVLGSLHPHTLSTKHNIAMCLSDKGDIEGALKLYYVVLEASNKILGAHHPHALSTKNNIAWCLSNQGLEGEALKLYHDVLELLATDTEEAHVALHPDTLTTKYNIARCLCNQGRIEEGLQLYYVVLEAQEKVLGNFHPDTLSTKHNIAACFRAQDQNEEAMKLYNAVLEAREEVLGALHPDTLNTKNNIAACLSAQGHKEEALKFYNVVLEEREKVLGHLHPDTLTTKHNIACVLCNQGQKEDGLKLSFAVLEAREKVLGPLHPDTLSTKNNIASCLNGKGQGQKFSRVVLLLD